MDGFEDFIMKDTARDELELKLFGLLLSGEGIMSADAKDAINEALEYVQINPTISHVEREIERLSYELDNYTATLSVMEKLS